MKKRPGIVNIVRDFLLGSSNKEFLVFLFFLLLSGAFWLFNALSDTYEAEVEVPVRMVKVPRNVVITADPADTLRVTVRDDGFSLLPYLFGRRLGTLLSTSPSMPTRTRRQDTCLWLTFRSSSDSNDEHYKTHVGETGGLGFTFNYGLSKSVPVRIAGKVVPARSYYLSAVKFFPERITIYASKRLLDSITYIPTEALNITNFSDTVSRPVNLKKIHGVKCVPSKVSMMLFPDILTEESFVVPIKAVNMPQGKVLRTFPSHVKVYFVVGAKLFRSVKPEQFSVTVDYNDLMAHPSDKCTLTVAASPHNVGNVRLDNAQVDYLIEQQ